MTFFRCPLLRSLLGVKRHALQGASRCGVPTKGETMTEVAKSRLSKPPGQRAVALVVASAATLFWLYTFYGIAQVPVGDGSGFQWIAVIPLGLIFLVLTLPEIGRAHV